MNVLKSETIMMFSDTNKVDLDISQNKLAAL